MLDKKVQEFRDHVPPLGAPMVKVTNEEAGVSTM